MGLPERLPFIPLKWQVMHLDGSAVGKIAIDGQTTTLDDASVHFEKNWGDKFPTRWHWLQANQFTGETDVAFVGAGSPIFPFGFSPEGYMLGLRVGDDFFSWRTQDLARFQRRVLRAQAINFSGFSSPATVSRGSRSPPPHTFLT